MNPLSPPALYALLPPPSLHTLSGMPSCSPFHCPKPIQHYHIMGANGIIYTAPPVTLPSCFLLNVIVFISIGLITSGLLICVRCLCRPARVVYILPLLHDTPQCKTEVMQHRASINGIEECSGRPKGGVRRDADRRTRAGLTRRGQQGQVEDMAPKFGVCSENTSTLGYVHIRSNRRTFNNAKY
ncbi:hypothetical protein BJV74DRAFT_545519 [Russula compacta]|nr:hypothetical protein BJV74DRAFT_545519 [Russula compacta]